ncbi:MAG: 16S rRNA (uracil(1498)-N(3))-methyltransferase [Paraperlucidibaca sp.]|nr:16S rRNA (uracil(1498)-N(3))-methyltransferase [Paraperlucidibaca sp.]
MNLITFTSEDLIAPDTLVLRDRRLQHLLTVNRPEIGSLLKVGELGGMIGQGDVIALSPEQATLRIRLDTPPPPKREMALVLALPRPKMLKRILQMVVTLGVTELVLINSFRVEKSFWQSPWLSEAAIAEQLRLGLEQAGDTVAPRVTLAPRFKPFVEDDLPTLMQGRQGWVAHPAKQANGPQEGSAETRRLSPSTKPTLLAIGPEGGFIVYEIEKLQAAGLVCCDLGPRILRVETAVAVALGQLLP